jgi:hypothetical protein
MRRMQGQHLTIQLTTFRRNETTRDVTMLKKRTTTRTRGGSRHVAVGMQDEVVIHACHGWHVAAGMQDEVVIHTSYLAKITDYQPTVDKHLLLITSY